MPNDFNVGNAVKQLIWTGVSAGRERWGGGRGDGGHGDAGTGRRGDAVTRRWGDAGTGRGGMAGWRAPARFAGLWRGMWRRLRSSKMTYRSPFWTTGRCFPAIAC